MFSRSKSTTSCNDSLGQADRKHGYERELHSAWSEDRGGTSIQVSGAQSDRADARYILNQKFTNFAIACAQTAITNIFQSEERKAIAREIRLAQRKEKKRIKSEAKQQRKLNDLLHRKLVSSMPSEQIIQQLTFADSKHGEVQ